MNSDHRIRKTGVVCIAAAVIWGVAISIEYPLHLQPPGSGTMFTLDQVIFLGAIFGYLIGLALVTSNRNPEVVTL